MARIARSLPRATALGAALALLVAATPSAAAGNGGAAPTAAAALSGGAAPDGSGGGDGGGSGASGASGPTGDRGSRSGATTARTGGAAPGRPTRRARTPRRSSPLRRRVVRRQTRRQPARKAPAPAAPAPPSGDELAGTVPGRFPVVGPYTFGGEGSRFDAGRPGHRHQGQDVAAASGTPIVAPLDGTIAWKANQPGGAGIYLVLRGDDGRDYVFMHLKRGSVVVAAGEAVTAGQPLAQVGATGIASGPHLHFELWVGGWQASGGAPIDPLPQLQRWARGTD